MLQLSRDYKHAFLYVSGDAQSYASTSIDDMKDGEIWLVDEQGKLLQPTDIANTEYMRFAYKRKGAKAPFLGPLFKKEWISQIAYQDYKAPTKKIVVVGFDGTTGSLVPDGITVGDDYAINIELNGVDVYQTYLLSATAKDTSECQLLDDMISMSLESLNYFTDSYKKHYVYWHRLTDAAGTAIGSATVKKGDKFIVINSNVDINPGDYVRFGTTNASPVLRVVDVDHGNDGTNDFTLIELETFWYLDDYTGDLQKVVSGATDKWGIKFMQHDLEFTPCLNDYYNDYSPAEFYVTASDNMAQPVELSRYDKGLGTWMEVASNECTHSTYYGGAAYPKDVKIKGRDPWLPLMANETCNYNSYIIRVDIPDVPQVDELNPDRHPYMHVIYVVDGSAADNYVAAVVTELNV